MIALLALTVGFAAITTTLVINGTLSIGPDGESFDSDVIFSKAKISEGSGKAFIASDGKSLNFTADLMELGSEVDLRYDITNKNRQYDAAGTISCDFIDETNAYNEYITISEVPEDFTVKGGTKTTGYVSVRLVKSFAGDATINSADIEFKCTLKLEADERDDLAPELPSLYKDPELNGADPVLTNGLIPISLTNDGKVIYADQYNKWYDYSTKRWANAVLLVDGKDSLYDEGDVIKEEDIESYFVWIPRYRYKLWNADQASEVIQEEPTSNSSAVHSIEIAFESKNTEPSMGTQNDEWLTHPAFTSFDVNGIWVGKFETGLSGEKSTSNFIYDVDKLIIKPNVASWRYLSAGNAVQVGYNYKRELDSHMMKNTEWGAVAYLTHSIYGINGDVNVNNNSSYLTGYSAIDSSTTVAGTDVSVTQPYNTEIGYKASTTGNIYGIYDLSGGAWEYVAGYISNGNSNLSTGSSFAYQTADPEGYKTKSTKYATVYPYDSSNDTDTNNYATYKNAGYGYGDAILETSTSGSSTTRWFGDYSYFPYTSSPFFLRGGLYYGGSFAGAFSFSRGSGNAPEDMKERARQRAGRRSRLDAGQAVGPVETTLDGLTDGADKC